MPEEYFEIALLNFDKAILCGRAKVNGALVTVEQRLTGQQREQWQALLNRHGDEMDRLLATFVDRNPPAEAAPAA